VPARVKRTQGETDRRPVQGRYVTVLAVLILAALSAAAFALVSPGRKAAPPARTAPTRPHNDTTYSYCVEDTEGGQAWHFSSDGGYTPPRAPYKNTLGMQRGVCPGSSTP
jgi:hypothetical protein